MHPSSMENMAKIRDKYLDIKANPLKVLDVGGFHNNPDKTYQKIFDDIDDLVWIVVDIVKHPSVTVVMEDPLKIPFPDNSFDLVVSGQMLEHCCQPFKMVAEMKRVVKPDGYIAIIAPSIGHRHDKQDGWRFLDDAFRFIAEDVGLEIIADWIDNDSPKWKDHCFVGRKHEES
jgi:SAM-dependent methyltransferase